jgi:hypothetical protein
MKCAVLLLISTSLPVWGWDLAYTATVNSQSDRWALPSEDLTFVYGGNRANVRYTATNFIAPFTGLFTFSSIGMASWDNYLVLYRTAFNPNTPLVNAVVANDNNPNVGTAGFRAVLTGGEQYFVVTSAAFNGGGTFQAVNTITGVPEPSTWMMLATGLFACWYYSSRPALARQAVRKRKEPIR